MNTHTRLVSAVYGCVIAFAGFEHGLGEALQGNVTPPGIVIQSWPHSEALRLVAGEPAMTLIPNLLFSGILTMLLSLVIAWWSLVRIHSGGGGLVLILMSVGLLLVGGGFAPPFMGLIVGLAATRINSPLRLWRQLPDGLLHMLASVRRSMLAVSLVGYFSMVPGLLLLVPLLGLEDPAAVSTMALLAFLGFFGAIFGALAEDALAQREYSRIFGDSC